MLDQEKKLTMTKLLTQKNLENVWKVYYIIDYTKLIHIAYQQVLNSFKLVFNSVSLHFSLPYSKKCSYTGQKNQKEEEENHCSDITVSNFIEDNSLSDQYKLWCDCGQFNGVRLYLYDSLIPDEQEC